MACFLLMSRGSFSLITQFTSYADARPASSHSQESLEVRVSQGSSYESRTGGLTSRRLCGPGGYHSWTRCDKRLLRPATRVAVPQRRRQRAHRSRRRKPPRGAVGQAVRRAVPLVLRTLRDRTLQSATRSHTRQLATTGAILEELQDQGARKSIRLIEALQVLERTAARAAQASEKPTRRSHRV